MGMKNVITKLAKYEVQDKKDLRADEKQRIKDAKNVARKATVDAVVKDLEDDNTRLELYNPQIVNDRQDARQFINKIPSSPRETIELNLYTDLGQVQALQSIKEWSLKYLEKRVSDAANNHNGYLTQ